MTPAGELERHVETMEALRRAFAAHYATGDYRALGMAVQDIEAALFAALDTLVARLREPAGALSGGGDSEAARPTVTGPDAPVVSPSESAPAGEPVERTDTDALLREIRASRAAGREVEAAEYERNLVVLVAALAGRTEAAERALADIREDSEGCLRASAVVDSSPHPFLVRTHDRLRALDSAVAATPAPREEGTT